MNNILVTNFRDFVLVGKDSDGDPIKMESYSLAENESAFWTATADPSAMSAEHSERFIEYLKRVMLHAAPLAAPEDVAWFLASYARDAKKRIESVDLPALATVRSAFEEALGLTLEQIIDLMGESAFDVYLNEAAYWKNMPKRVWEYTIGGYQVIKKWLSYREYDLLNRSLTKEEAREVTNIARRIAAILLLEPYLNANYEIIKNTSYDWAKLNPFVQSG